MVNMYYISISFYIMQFRFAVRPLSEHHMEPLLNIFVAVCRYGTVIFIMDSNKKLSSLSHIILCFSCYNVVYDNHGKTNT